MCNPVRTYLAQTGTQWLLFRQGTKSSGGRSHITGTSAPAADFSAGAARELHAPPSAKKLNLAERIAPAKGWPRRPACPSESPDRAIREKGLPPDHRVPHRQNPTRPVKKRQRVAVHGRSNWQLLPLHKSISSMPTGAASGVGQWERAWLRPFPLPDFTPAVPLPFKSPSRAVRSGAWRDAGRSLVAPPPPQTNHVPESTLPTTVAWRP